MKVAVAQITSTNQPDENLKYVLDLMEQSVGQDILFLPEVTNCISSDWVHLNNVLGLYEGNCFIKKISERARDLKIWVALGSVAVKVNSTDERYVNRSILINSNGGIVAWYDKIHMFDVTISDTESYQESKHYQQGKHAVLAQTPWANIGLTICYDLRFAGLYRTLAKSGAQILTAPAAFTCSTGKAHWHTLIKSRAIETGCFLIASAQTGEHPGSNRKTYGHSLIVNPWGEVILDGGKLPGLFFAKLDLREVKSARNRIPSLSDNSEFKIR
ncbi:carbon-nitrogen hydrolase family protein [Planktomarina sp.]|nr:carbon-nitrogen hydrolase family protein [Planktomarina sp.]